MAGAKCKARVFFAAALAYARYIGDMKILLRIILILACAILSDVLWSAEGARVVSFHGFNNCIELKNKMARAVLCPAAGDGF